MNALAMAKFRVYGKTIDDREVDYTVEVSLEKSGAFAYGNQTCMVFKWSYGAIESFDTRYERVSPATFSKCAKEVLDSRTADTINVEEIS